MIITSYYYDEYEASDEEDGHYVDDVVKEDDRHVKPVS